MDLGIAGKIAVVAGGSRGCGRGRGSLAAFLCSERAAFLTGETIRLDDAYTESLFQRSCEKRAEGVDGAIIPSILSQR